MTDREKLIELLEDAEGMINNDIPTLEQIADYLIAHGMTIQNWIPVTERLPEVNTDAIVYSIEGYIGTDFRTTNGNWFWNDELPVTHWMPLPEAPKEVDHG